MTRGKRSWCQRPSWLVPLGIAGLILFGLAGFKIASESGLKREMEAIRAKGLPTNPRELDAWYARVPIEENAALKFLEARVEFVEANDLGAIDWRAIPHDKRLNSETVRLLKSHSEKNVETLRLMRAASEFKRSRYPTDLSRAPDLDFKHLSPINGLAQLARWEAVLQSEEGNAEAALDALKSGFGVARTEAQEQLMF